VRGMALDVHSVPKTVLVVAAYFPLRMLALAAFALSAGSVRELHVRLMR
jgi:hypothetical protein